MLWYQANNMPDLCQRPDSDNVSKIQARYSPS